MPTRRSVSFANELPMPDDRAVLAHMPGSDIPVIRQPFVKGDRLPYWATTRFTGNHLYDRGDDPDEEHNLAGTGREAEMAEGRASCSRDGSATRSARPFGPRLSTVWSPGCRMCAAGDEAIEMHGRLAQSG